MQDTTLRVATPVGLCGYCGSTIGLQPPMPGTPVQEWVCKGCHSVYFARAEDYGWNLGLTPAEDVGPFLAALADGREDKPSFAPRRHIQQLVETLAAKSRYADERREHTRHPVAVPVTAIPLSSNLRVAGEPLTMTTMNISLGGAALIHHDPCDAPFLALDFTPAGLNVLQAVLRVVRESRIGLLHVVAGEFLAKLSMPTKEGLKDRTGGHRGNGECR